MKAYDKFNYDLTKISLVSNTARLKELGAKFLDPSECKEHIKKMIKINLDYRQTLFRGCHTLAKEGFVSTI